MIVLTLTRKEKSIKSHVTSIGSDTHTFEEDLTQQWYQTLNETDQITVNLFFQNDIKKMYCH